MGHCLIAIWKYSEAILAVTIILEYVGKTDKFERMILLISEPAIQENLWDYSS